MTVTLELKPEIEAEVTRQANAQGVALSEQIDRLIAEAIRRQPPLAPLSTEAQKEKNQAAIELLNQWDDEDETDDPEEIVRRQAEWEGFKTGYEREPQLSQDSLSMSSMRVATTTNAGHLSRFVTARSWQEVA